MTWTTGHGLDEYMESLEKLDGKRIDIYTNAKDADRDPDFERSVMRVVNRAQRRRTISES
jgi:hypothetical protein